MFETIRQMKKRDERGFTLIELLIVIAIIAILAAIALPQFAAYRERGIRATMISDARNIVSQMEGFYADCQSYYTQAGLVNGPNTFNVAPIGICTAAVPQTLMLSSGNSGSVTISQPAAGANGYTIVIDNANSGTGYHPLTMNGGGAVTPECKWTNGNPCQ
jgi:type IV pilus assembly protein PilA